MSSKVALKRIRQTQLNVINGTVHFHMARGTLYEVQWQDNT
jgi:hypothetical protein